ncbi:MAG: twin-arginine translocase TatA/TatE family subunit [Deltaproteobacteria bacterium]|nr:twin-arginine translocase TatA/TatE family subunit [Deltaproteobacteria bacterium]
MLGTWEIIAILAVVVLLFGASKLPQLGKGLGEAIGNFKRAKAEGEANALRGNEVDATPRIDAQPVQKLDGTAAGQTDGVRR